MCRLSAVCPFGPERQRDSWRPFTKPTGRQRSPGAVPRISEWTPIFKVVVRSFQFHADVELTAWGPGHPGTLAAEEKRRLIGVLEASSSMGSERTLTVDARVGSARVRRLRRVA